MRPTKPFSLSSQSTAQSIVDGVMKQFNSPQQPALGQSPTQSNNATQSPARAALIASRAKQGGIAW